MKQKIHREFILVALTTILLTTVVVTAVFYSFFKKEVMEELSTCAEVLSSTGVFEGANETDANRSVPGWGLEPVRISLINADGTVLYDGNVNIGGLDNHGNRPRSAAGTDGRCGAVCAEDQILWDRVRSIMRFVWMMGWCCVWQRRHPVSGDCLPVPFRL